jgi:hypothetical protein
VPYGGPPGNGRPRTGRCGSIALHRGESTAAIGAAVPLVATAVLELNAAVVSCLTGVVHRYQARLVWLLTFAVLASLLRFLAPSASPRRAGDTASAETPG